jgi:membrane dipeptidase
VTCREELDENLTRGRLSAVVGLEGAYPLGRDPGRLREFWELGVRVLGPSHLIPNAFASCSFWGYRDLGLSAAGRELLAEMARLGMILDVSHASPRALDDMLREAAAALSVFDSHTGVKGATPHWRNLDDSAVRGIAARRGVVAVILARKYLGETGLAGFLRHVRHAVGVAGAGAVAIGSDFDGMVALPREIRDVTDYPKLAPALAGAGLGRSEVMGILGGNLVEFLGRALPPRKAG